MKKVLFLSSGNSSRSQMAEGIFNYHYKNVAIAYSAGVTPTILNSLAVKVMNEIGIDISGHTVNNPDDYKDEQFDYIITLCEPANKMCPIFWTNGEAIYLHIGFESPEEFEGTPDQKIDKFRQVRDQIEERLLRFFDGEFGMEPADQLNNVNFHLSLIGVGKA